MCRGFRVHHPLIDLEVVAEEVRKLKFHEEVIPNVLAKLVEDIKTDGCIKHPIIVDMKTLIILDGTHRVAAIENLNCQYVPVCFVNYINSLIEVRRWYRIVTSPTEDVLETLVSTVERFGLAVEEKPLEQVSKLVKDGRTTLGLADGKKAFAARMRKETSVKEAYDVVKKIEAQLRSEGFNITYHAEQDAEKKIKSSFIHAMVMVPLVTKEEVVKTVAGGQLFAPKSTRHVFPVKLAFINIPTDWMSGEVRLEKVNERIVRQLSEKQIMYLTSSRKSLPSGYAQGIYIFR